MGVLVPLAFPTQPSLAYASSLTHRVVLWGRCLRCTLMLVCTIVSIAPRHFYLAVLIQYTSVPVGLHVPMVHATPTQCLTLHAGYPRWSQWQYCCSACTFSKSRRTGTTCNFLCSGLKYTYEYSNKAQLCNGIQDVHMFKWQLPRSDISPRQYTELTFSQSFLEASSCAHRSIG